jgi:uncharacterized glyoxalase superfamily protein PhnB
MNLKKLVPLVTTGHLSELKDFYSKHFGFKVTIEVSTYLGLAGANGAELSFMSPDEDAQEAFEGKGLTLCFEVTDVDAEANRLVAAGVPVIVPLRDNPWGDRSIILRDPIGIHVYVYQSTPENATHV